ncbi:quinon protein alcohol dehydrogenase-like superfamily [Gongronella butleri]|nr:quinon protein alcohol dehydrogenase-like superfamily [Gongronella butleri]
MSKCHRHELHTNHVDTPLSKDLQLVSAEQRRQVQTTLDIFDHASAAQRMLILKGLLSSSCTPQLSYLWENVQQLLRTDFTLVFPTEVTLRIFTHLDAQTLCSAAQVNRRWRDLANDDTIWHRLCEQHIDKKCAKCGWGLPLLQKRKIMRIPVPEATISKVPALPSPAPSRKRTHDHDTTTTTNVAANASSPCESSAVSSQAKRQDRKPWKSVYSERLVVERHWRKHQAKAFTVRQAHTDSILAVAFCDAQNILMTASKDKSIKMWSLADGQHIRSLTGHTRAVTSLQFDDAKIVSGSMDHTLKIWNLHTGSLIRTLEGHTGGVLSLHFDCRLLASGSDDGVIKVWNFRNGECSTLSGHTEAVNHVRVFENSTRLLSSSTDGRLILWDLDSKQQLRVFEGHQASVQATIPSMPGFLHRFYEEEVLDAAAAAAAKDDARASPPPSSPTSITESSTPSSSSQQWHQQQLQLHRSGAPVAISASQDKTLKVWSLTTGRCLATLFGHNKGIQALAYDKLRMISGDAGGQLRIWDIENGQVMHTVDIFDGSAINAVGLSDTKIVCASEAGDFRVADFGV